jgi:pimeloyl-ACP methyl ester carboxylesterase
METPPTRAFTPARLVALALIGLGVLGLAYLRFAPDSGAVSVPHGAKAGDLTLEACEYATEDGSYKAECGALVVPENRHDPASRLIAVPVKRIPAQSASPGTPVFGLYGGPGHSNFEFTTMSRFADDRDVVLVGYRGVDGSVHLDCPEVVESRESSRDWLETSSLESDAAAFRACADRLRDEGADLAGYTILQRVDDLELVRRKLGYGPIDLVSESFGTRVALIYAWRYPKSVHRSVLVGANPPGHFLWDAGTTREQIRRYAGLCAQDESCRTRTDDLAASFEEAYDRIPSRWWFLPIKKGNVQAAALFGLFNATTDGGGFLAGPLTLDTFRASEQGDASGMWLLSVAAQLTFPRVQIAGDVMAMARSDAAYVRRFAALPAVERMRIGNASNEFLWAGGRALDAWPGSSDEKLYDRVRDSDVETLLVGGELDGSTPPQVVARELLPHLPNGRQVVLPKLGHTEDVWAYQPEASTRLIETYLDSGRVDTSLYTENSIDLTPPVTHGTMAKITLGTMLGLAALTVLSLFLMALRVRWHGPFGRKLSCVLRAVYVLVLGLGGLMLGLLVALTALPTVALADERLVALSVGVPIGLGLYFAWVNRDWSRETKALGLATACAGALSGAWLGFEATEVPGSLLAAILGAAVGGNLTLLALDIVWDSQARARFVATDAKETLEARPLTG